MKYAKGKNLFAASALEKARDYERHWTAQRQAFAHLLSFGPRRSRKRSGRPDRADPKPNLPVWANNPLLERERPQAMERRRRGGWYAVRKRSVFPEAS